MKKFYLFMASLLAFGSAWAQTTAPEEGTIYYITNNRQSGKFVKAVKGLKFLQTAADGVTGKANQFKFVPVTETTDIANDYKILSVAYNAYVNNVNGGLTENAADAKTWYLNDKGDNNVYISSKNGAGDEGWNDEGGVYICHYSTFDDAGSLFQLKTAKEVYESQVSAIKEAFSVLESAAHATNPLFPNTDKVAQAKSIVEAVPTTVPATNAEAEGNLGKLYDAMNLKNLVNQSEDHLYFIGNDRSGSNYRNMSACLGHEVSTIAADNANKKASRAIWKIEFDNQGECSVQNYLTHEYLQRVGNQTDGKQSPVKMGEQAVPCVIYYYGDQAEGYVALGSGELYGYLNFPNGSTGGGRVKGYSTHYFGSPDGGSKIMITAVNQEDLDVADVLETAYASEDVSDAESSVSAMKATLGVTENVINSLEYSSLNEYIDKDFSPWVYKAAEGNVYSIKAAEGNHYVGKYLTFTDDATKPQVRDDANTLNGLWRLVAKDNGFQMVNCNLEAAGKPAAIGRINDDNTTEAVLFAEEGQAYWINALSDGSVQFKYDNGSGNKALNSDNGWGLDGHLNKWDAENSHFTIAKVESVDLELHAVGEKSYATAYLPFAVKGVSGAKAYTAAAPANGEMVLTEASAVAANTGIVLIGTGDKAMLTIGEGADAASKSALTGTTVAKTVEANSKLTLGMSDDKVGFFTYEGTGLRANSAYLEAGTGAAAVVFSFAGEGGETDGIEGITAATKSGKMYDLSGRRISKAGKGIYIVNGKKVIK